MKNNKNNKNMNIDENAENIIKNYISCKFSRQEDNQIDDKILKENKFFDMFIKISEQAVLTAPENFAVSIMAALQKINEGNPIKTIPELSKKMRAVVCFASAVVIMLSTVFGVNAKIFDFLSENTVKIEKIGEFMQYLNIISYFN